jgi:hypothetical protein
MLCSIAGHDGLGQRRQGHHDGSKKGEFREFVHGEAIGGGVANLAHFGQFEIDVSGTGVGDHASGK